MASAYTICIIHVRSIKITTVCMYNMSKEMTSLDYNATLFLAHETNSSHAILARMPYILNAMCLVESIIMTIAIVYDEGNNLASNKIIVCLWIVGCDQDNWNLCFGHASSKSRVQCKPIIHWKVCLALCKHHAVMFAEYHNNCGFLAEFTRANVYPLLSISCNIRL